MTHLILIRHGETEWTKAQRFQGSTNTVLTARGKRQAKAVAQYLKRYKIDRLYSSPMTRARQTSEPISKVIGKKAVLDKRLSELRFGAWEGKSAADLWKDKKSGYHDWCRGKIVTPQGGEKLTAFRTRVRNFLKAIAKKKDQKIVIVTHGGPVKMILYEALNLPMRSLWSFRIDTASITVLGVGKHFAQVYSLNDTSHMPLSLRPNSYL